MASQTRILIADDHAIVRRGLKQIFADEQDMLVAGEAQNAAEVLEMVRKGNGDFLILDISMPGANGLDLLKEVKHLCPLLPVLVLSVHSEELFAVRALRAGASGYMTKETAPEELVKAVQKIRSGGKYISQSLAENLASSLGGSGVHAPHELLSDREYQVFCEIASGREVSEIARSLSLSVKTVSAYRTRILEKMGMRTNAELTHYAIQNGLIH